MKFVDHVFKRGDTIEGVIRLHNSHAMTPAAARIFMTFYANLNPDSGVPSVGSQVKIPVDERIARLNG